MPRIIPALDLQIENAKHRRKSLLAVAHDAEVKAEVVLEYQRAMEALRINEQARVEGWTD